MPNDPHRLSPAARVRVWAAPTILLVRDFCRDCIEDIPLLTRIISHVGLLLIMFLTIAASSFQINSGDKTDSAIAPSGEDANPFQDSDIADNGFLGFAPMPITTIPKRVRREVTKYTVQPGDTVSDIAAQFEVTPDSILWANPKLEDNPDMLALDQVLNIPPATGVLYTVQNGDSLQKIADKFKSSKTPAAKLLQNILDFEFNQELHDLQPPDYALTTGQFLMVPGGSKPYVPRVVTTYSGPVPGSAARGTGLLGWPTSGSITQKFWSRHPGIDIGAPKGAPVRAADSGYVVAAGWDNERVSYGFMILISHGNGYVTRYAHLSSIDVDTGTSVKKGQLIGRVGSTGNSTGPHLHFEVIYNGNRRNPFSYLR